MDKEYWDSYYKRHGLDEGIQEASSFAKFCQNKFFKYKEKTIFEIGSGNGRDAKYFAKNKHTVTAVDQSHEGVVLGGEIHLNNIQFIENDFINMDYSIHNDIDVFYSRFTLHAIKEEECDMVIDKVFNSLKRKGMFAIEVRSTKDCLCGIGKDMGNNAWVTDHYRRFVDSRIFIRSMLSKGFQLLYFIEEDNLSTYKNDNPVLIRALFEK